jgi:glycosidase
MKLKIIADFVPNHCSKYHPFFKDAQEKKDSEYKKWFYFKKWPNKYLSFLSIEDLPKLNLENKNTREYIINAAKYWLNFGLDGYRLDHVIGPSIKFWNEFNNEIKKSFPNTIFIGEAWMKGIKFNELKTLKVPQKYIKWLKSSSSDNILKEYINVFDGVLDFKFQELIKLFVAYNQISYKEFFSLLNKHYNIFPNNFYLPNFLDNHDMNRFLFECNNDKNKLKNAIKYQFMFNQPVIIYYGTEVGLIQNNSIWDIKSHGDLQVRMPMIWKNYDRDLFNYYKKIIHKRSNV